MKKGIIIKLIITLAIVSTLIGCGKGSNPAKSSNAETSEATKGKHDVFKCIDLIDTTNSLDEINEIIGFEGQPVGDSGKVYAWDLSDDTDVEVQFFDNDTCRIDIHYPDKSVASDKVDFSKYDEIEKALNNGDSLTYDELVEKVGGVQGTLQTKDSTDLAYAWHNSEGGYLIAYFKRSSGECSMTTGMF